jgi:hypothetical protein
VSGFDYEHKAHFTILLEASCWQYREDDEPALRRSTPTLKKIAKGQMQRWWAVIPNRGILSG